MSFGTESVIVYLFVTHIFKYAFFVSLILLPMYWLGRLFNPRKVTRK